MIRSVTQLFIVCLLALPGSSVAEGMLQQLVGTWEGGGEVRGMDSRQTMVWSTVLGDKFVQLQFNNHMQQDKGPEYHFQAHAYYQVSSDGEVSGHWFDSRGVKFPLEGTFDASRLIIEWGDPAIELGRTEYRIAGDRMKVTDEVLGTKGSWQVFGRSTLQRVN